jgi:hypothetical protein
MDRLYLKNINYCSRVPVGMVWAKQPFRPPVVSIQVAFNRHFPDNQSTMAGVMLPRRMFQEIVLLIPRGVPA